MTTKEMIYAGALTLVGSLAAVAISKVNRLCKRLNTSLDDIESRTTFEVSDQLIDEVVEDMATRKLDRVIPSKVEKAVEAIAREAKDKIRNDVTAEVTKASPEIKETLRKQLKDVSIEQMKKSVISEAAERAKDDYLREIEKKKDELIDKLEDYEDEMEDKIRDKADDIVDDLEDKAEDKFDDELENLTSRYKTRLDDIGNIYSSIANKMKIN